MFDAVHSRCCSLMLPGRVAQSVTRLTLERARGPGFYTRSGTYILSFLLPLIQEGKFSIRGEYICTMYIVQVNHLGGLSLPRKSIVMLTYRPDMTIQLFTLDVK